MTKRAFDLLNIIYFSEVFRMDRYQNDVGVLVPRVMLPDKDADFYRWAVVACDQFTSQPEYWEKAREIIGTAPSTLDLFLPEAYLGKPDESERIEKIRNNMREYVNKGIIKELEQGFVLVTRTVAGNTRYGLVLALDLEAYDFHKGSETLIRATEGTIESRIPPRLRIREGAPLELPHILVLIDDPKRTVIEPLVDEEERFPVLYDTDLMLDGGHITGSFIKEENLEGAKAALSALYDEAEEKYGIGHVIFQAMGDGNHSLATAKTAWENIKKTLSPEEISTHPARYALCEIENIHDEGIVFEPIHRVIFANGGESGMELVTKVCEHLDQYNGNATIVDADAPVPEGAFSIPFITLTQRGKIIIEKPESKLEVGCLQHALDIMVKEEKTCGIDYIHGTAAVEKLSKRDGNAGFMLPAMDKFMLFPAVAADGALPRKTFSMGEANEKRYYIEARYIAK